MMTSGFRISIAKMAGVLPRKIGANRFPAFSPPLNLSVTMTFARRLRPLYLSTLLLLRCSSQMASNGVTDDISPRSPKIPKLSDAAGDVVLSGDGDARRQLLKVKKLSDNAVIPARSSACAAGYDLSSAVETKVPARGKALVPTDLSIAIPQGCYARIAPRSGLAWKYSMDVGAGVVDADYRGPVSVVLFNHSDVDFEVKIGDRIAQLIIEVILTPEVVVVDDLGDTARGDGGFGSTGV